MSAAAHGGLDAHDLGARLGASQCAVHDLLESSLRHIGATERIAATLWARGHLVEH